MAYKVIHWGTGAMGKNALKTIIQHPELELVGWRVYSLEKVGLDAGEYVGLPAIGVTSTDSFEEVLSISADIVSWFPGGPWAMTDISKRGTPADKLAKEMCQLLASGKNVSGLGLMELAWPDKTWPAWVTDQIKDACEQGSSTCCIVGPDPGWMTDGILLEASRGCHRIEKLYSHSAIDFIHYPNEFTSRKRGFMQKPAYFDRFATDEEFMKSSDWWRESTLTINMFADVMGITLDEVSGEITANFATEPAICAFGTVQPGEAEAIRFYMRGYKHGEVVCEMSRCFRARQSYKDADNEWGGSEGHFMRIEGTPPLQLDMPYNDPEWPYSRAAMTTCGQFAVNHLPFVCRADTGFKTIFDLPPAYGTIHPRFKD